MKKQPTLGSHRITQKDMITRRGICSSCGDVDLTTQGRCAERHRQGYRVYLDTATNRKRHNAASRRYQKRNKEKISAQKRDFWYIRNYGLTRVEFEAILDRQNGSCAICGTTEPGGQNWHLDHDHRFNKNDKQGHRGILCVRCNMGIGCLKDDVRRLRAAIRYLETFKPGA